MNLPDRQKGGIERKGNFINNFIVPWDLWLKVDSSRSDYISMQCRKSTYHIWKCLNLTKSTKSFSLNCLSYFPFRLLFSAKTSDMHWENSGLHSDCQIDNVLFMGCRCGTIHVIAIGLKVRATKQSKILFLRGWPGSTPPPLHPHPQGL